MLVECGQRTCNAHFRKFETGMGEKGKGAHYYTPRRRRLGRKDMRRLWEEEQRGGDERRALGSGGEMRKCVHAHAAGNCAS